MYDHYYKLFVLIISSVIKYYSQFVSDVKLNEEIYSEATSEATDIIQKYGYPAENHTVETSDGYILVIHRIPYGKNSSKAGGIPVILQHGVGSGSPIWFTNGEKSFAFVLADEGYDVWAINFRGNRYSSHRTYSHYDSEFWDFSASELGKYDEPAIIDYVLNVTKYPKVFLIGHSLGTAVTFGTLALLTEYNEKVAAFFALGPAVSCGYETSILISGRNPLAGPLFRTLESFGFHDLSRLTPLATNFFKVICPPADATLCWLFLNGFTGYNPSLRNTTRDPIYFMNTLYGTSTKLMIHTMTVCLKKRGLTDFDYGETKNRILYGSPVPPEFMVENITAPVVLVHASNDAITDPLDVELLKRRLNNLYAVELLDDPMANHMDMVIGVEIRELVLNKLISYMKNLWVH